MRRCEVRRGCGGKEEMGEGMGKERVRAKREDVGYEDGGGGRCGIAVSHVLTNSSIFKFGPTFFTLSIGSP